MSRAIDAFSDGSTRNEVRTQLLKYFETDTILLVLRYSRTFRHRYSNAVLDVATTRTSQLLS